jgi:hypothetical protein
MIDPGWAAVIAAAVSLLLGLASIMRSASDSKQTQIRERQQRRAEAYVDVLRIVEIRGLAVQDQMYKLHRDERRCVRPAGACLAEEETQHAKSD